MTSALDSLPRRSCYRAVRNRRADNERLASLFRFLRAIPGANAHVADVVAVVRAEAISRFIESCARK